MVLEIQLQFLILSSICTTNNNSEIRNTSNDNFNAPANSGADDFADFSSAFGSKTHCDNAKKNQMFGGGGAIPAPPLPQALGGLDLMGSGGAIIGGKETSNLDLLGGIGGFGGTEPASTMPNLMNAPHPPVIGGFNQPLVGGNPSLLGGVSTGIPPLQPGLAAFHQPPQPNASALIDSPVLLNPSFGQNTTNAVSSTAEAQKQIESTTKLPSTWKDVGSLSLDLANFSLSNATEKKAAVSMNAMKTSQQSSSSKSSPSPLSPMGKGGFPAPIAPALQPQQQSGPGSFDLL